MNKPNTKHRFSNRLAATLLASTLVPLAASAADLNVSINDIKTDDGRLMITVVNTEEQLADGTEAPASMILAASTQGVKFTLHNLPAGTYGVQLFHDENNNGELDANLLGIPKEPWAFSNNAAGKFGPPKWKDIRFEITADDQTVNQEISLNH